MTLTRRQRFAVTVSVVVVLVLAVVAVRVATRTPDCTVTSGDTVVELSTEQAEGASRGRAAGLEGADLRLVRAAFAGTLPHALSCRHGGAAESGSSRLNSRGLTMRAEAVRDALIDRPGELVLGGYQRGGVTTGHMAGSAHYQGRAIDVFFRPINSPNVRRGWATAHYLVANAEALQITTVIFDAKIWTHARASQGWRRYRIDTTGRPAAVRRVLLHRDHVHVDVAA